MKVITWIKQHKWLAIFLVLVVIGVAIRPYAVGVLLGIVGIPVFIWWAVWGRERKRRRAEHMGECPICHKFFPFTDNSFVEYAGEKQTIKKVCKDCSTKTTENKEK